MPRARIQLFALALMTTLVVIPLAGSAVGQERDALSDYDARA